MDEARSGAVTFAPAPTNTRRPLTDPERPLLRRMGRRLREIREDAGCTRHEVAEETGLNEQSIYRIEVGLRRTRRSTLRVLAGFLAEDPDALTDELVETAGSALADESPYSARIAKRRARRLRRIGVLAQRDEYWRQRATLEAEWGQRAARHAAFRADMRSFDVAFRVLRRLGVLD